uniref:Uncharacterized protein n=1 Tax=Varanus komodoensis TaxID=61221 RepID=A0A8D2JF69_VARKO
PIHCVHCAQNVPKDKAIKKLACFETWSEQLQSETSISDSSMLPKLCEKFPAVLAVPCTARGTPFPNDLAGRLALVALAQAQACAALRPPPRPPLL